MSDIFISYASEDKSRVQALARALERKGWSVWWDRRIPAGKSFDKVIHEALKAAKSVVVVWTKTSVKSTWVRNESRSGLRRNILFPVILLDEVEIPLEFEHLASRALNGLAIGSGAPRLRPIYRRSGWGDRRSCDAEPGHPSIVSEADA